MFKTTTLALLLLFPIESLSVKCSDVIEVIDDKKQEAHTRRIKASLKKGEYVYPDLVREVTQSPVLTIRAYEDILSHEELKIFQDLIIFKSVEALLEDSKNLNEFEIMHAKDFVNKWTGKLSFFEVEDDSEYNIQKKIEERRKQRMERDTK